MTHYHVKSIENLTQTLKQIESEGKFIIKPGGEGIVLRNPRAFYETKRSWGSLKFKTYLEDEFEVKSTQITFPVTESCHIIVDAKGQEMRVCSGLKSIGREVLSLRPGSKPTFKYCVDPNTGLPNKLALIKFVKSI